MSFIFVRMGMGRFIRSIRAKNPDSGLALINPETGT